MTEKTFSFNKMQCAPYRASWIIRTAAIFLALFCFSSAHAAAPASPAKNPVSVLAVYAGYKEFFQVEIMETYTLSQEHYRLSSVMKPVGLLAALKPEKITMDSSGLVVSQGLRPLHYSYRREREVEKNKLAEFDWDSRQLTMTHQG